MVSTRSAPASCSMSATRRAEIGSRGFAFRSWRAYGKSGMTAVMRFAEASFAAWIISISSMMCSSTGMHPVCTRNTSAPRIDSVYRVYVSPFLNVSSSTPPRPRPRWSAIACARSGCDRPEKTMSRFDGPRSIQFDWAGSVSVAFSRPGKASSAVRLSMLVVDPAFLRLLARCESCKGSGRDIIGDDRTGCNPSIVAHVDRCAEYIVDPGPDVAPDPRLTLGLALLMREIRGDVPCSDVRVGADVGVPDVGQVRDLRPRPDC